MWQTSPQAGQKVLFLLVIPHLTRVDGNPRKVNSSSHLFAFLPSLSDYHLPSKERYNCTPLQKNSITVLHGVPRGRESHHERQLPSSRIPQAPSTQTQFQAGEYWPRTLPRTQVQPVASQLNYSLRLRRPGRRRGMSREAPPLPSRGGRDRKRDGVRGGGAVAARGRGGGARRSLLRLGRERPGRRRAARLATRLTD